MKCQAEEVLTDRQEPAELVMEESWQKLVWSYQFLSNQKIVFFINQLLFPWNKMPKAWLDSRSKVKPTNTFFAQLIAQNKGNFGIFALEMTSLMNCFSSSFSFN